MQLVLRNLLRDFCMKKHRAKKVKAVEQCVRESILSDYIDYVTYSLDTSMTNTTTSAFLATATLNYFESKYKNTRFAWMFTEEVKDEIRGTTE